MIGAVSGIAFLMAFLMAMIIIVALLALYFKKRNNNDKVCTLYYWGDPEWAPHNTDTIQICLSVCGQKYLL